MAGWRRRGFQPVLNERLPRIDAEREGSLIYRALRLKQQHPLPSTTPLPDSFDFGLDRAQRCLPVERYQEIERQRPLWGMPYGLPALGSAEFTTLQQWPSGGARMPAAPAPSAAALAQIATWERFFNPADRRGQLVGRYLYEHLYLFNLQLGELEDAGYYKLVRSATPPGQPLQRISTRRPYDDPGVTPVYYRLVAERASVVAKTHIPYRLNGARRARWNSLFFGGDWDTPALPDYHPDRSSNPFATFAAIPVEARYRFMLDEAQRTIMAFIKGPVCRGQVAVNVINEHFWVFFADPGHTTSADTQGFLERQVDSLTLPAAASDSPLPIGAWVRFAASQADYLQAKTRRFNQAIANGLRLDERLVWDGDGDNPNAALTIFRHFDNAAVAQGLLGATPKTAWVIDYPLLERIHYLLVAGFDVFGNFGHQLITRLYMDFLRMEGEFNFLSLLPSTERTREREFWYRDAPPSIRGYIFGQHSKLHGEPAIAYRTEAPKLELYQRLQARLGPSTTGAAHRLQASPLSAASIELLQRLQALRGQGLAWLPEFSLLLVRTAAGGETLLSLIHHRAHAHISSLFDERDALRPEEDRITLLAGVLGDYPNALFRLDEARLPELANRLYGMQSERDYQALVGDFGVRRNDPHFWQLSDRVAELYRQQNPSGAGILDLNRLENR